MQRANVEIVEQVERALGLPTMVIAANWRGEYAVDLDEGAARVFFEVLRTSGLGDGEEIALVVAARGGLPAFADGVLRTLKGSGMSFRAYVPCPIDGVGSLIALGAREIVFHPFGGLGPVDSGPNVEPAAMTGLGAFEALRGLQGAKSRSRSERKTLARLGQAAHLRGTAQILARRIGAAVGRDVASVEALFTSIMGEGTALIAEDLRPHGFDARLCRGEEALALWKAFEHYERALHILDDPAPRFIASEEWADEVEFEPAIDVPAAIIATKSKEVFFELDTGSPDPDVERLHGRWRL